MPSRLGVSFREPLTPTTIQDRRPHRRYYELTDKGRLTLGAVLQEARSDARFADLRWRFA